MSTHTPPSFEPIGLGVENYHRLISHFAPGWDAGQTTLTNLAS